MTIARPVELFIGDQVRVRDTSRLMTIYAFEDGYRTALCNYLVGRHDIMYRERYAVDRLVKVERVRPK